MPSLVAALVLVGALATGCKRRPLAERPDERGKLNAIAARLEEAYASTPLPPVAESPQLADRLAKWDDFRGCTVRTYVARKRNADQAAREGRKRPSRHASIGDEAVEECAVQAAVIKKDRSWCERLALDFARADGLPAAPALRCWDTRARVLGLPDECPLLWQPNDVVARNPECLALARRDRSLCAFSDSPGRCAALFAGSDAACPAEGPSDCPLAVAYWSDLVPNGMGEPLLDQAKVKGAELILDVTVMDTGEPPVHLPAPKVASFVSWPAGRGAADEPPNPLHAVEFWGSSLPSGAVAMAFRGQPSARLWFLPGAETTGTRPLQAPDPDARASLTLVWADPGGVRRCAPASDTQGEVRFSLSDGGGAPRAGAMVEGTVGAERLVCSDGRTVRASGRFKVPILDLR